MSSGQRGPAGQEEADLVAAACAGDQAAFGTLVERYRHELRVHCYRMLASFDESEDQVQETFLRAWRKRETYQGRSTFRAWLYRIATNSCLDFLDRHPRQPVPRQPGPDWGTLEGLSIPNEIDWLQPYPDELLDVADPMDAGPDAVVVAKETIELAFLAALQHLPAMQRAVLILRDVLGWSAKETAELLDTSVASANSALQRARVTMKKHLPERRTEWAPSVDPTEAERELLRRYVSALEESDVDAMAELLREDVRVTMPLFPMWYAGLRMWKKFAKRVFDPASPMYHGSWRSVPTRANRQPAVAHYNRMPGDSVYRARVLDVLTVVDGKVAAVTAFEPRLFPAFGLPETLG